MELHPILVTVLTHPIQILLMGITTFLGGRAVVAAFREQWRIVRRRHRRAGLGAAAGFRAGPDTLLPPPWRLT